MDISAEETIKVAKDAVICSKHFRNSDHDECKKQYKILKRVCIERIKLKYLISLS
jgi:hypothetical protein